MKRKAVTVRDFRGGYATSLPPEIMDDNMLQTAENVYWREGLQKRQGWSVSVTTSGLGYTDPEIKEFHRFRINSKWRTLAVISDDTDMRILIDDDSGDLTEIDSSYTMSDGAFFIDSLGEQAVIVNGVDKPAIVYHDGSNFKIENLEAYDERERNTDDWYAGTYQSSAYVDDTTDAQNSDAGDFAVSTTTSGDGFYIASAVTFNKIFAKNLSASVAGTAVYEYYAGNGTWTAFTPTTDTGWNAAEDTTVEWAIFGYTDGEFDWNKYGDVLSQEDPEDADGDTVPGGMIGKYVIRVTFTGTPAARTVDYFTIYNTQYLSLITQGDIPERVKAYKNRLWLSSGSAVNYSPYGVLKGWREYEVEYFREGGNKILAIETNGRELYIFKASAIYRLRGDSFESFMIDKAADRGTVSGRSVGTMDQLLPFVSEDGIYIFDGTRPRKLSGHIQSDFDSLTTSDSCGIKYQGMYWIFFPTDEIALVFDPDTVRTDDLGEVRVSFWKFTNITANQVKHFSGDDDTGHLIASNGTNLIRLHNGNYYDETDTTIPVKIKTKEFTFGRPEYKKTYNRMKIDVLRAENWDLTVNADEVTNEFSTVIHSFGPENEHHIEEVSMPYEMDGRSLAVQLENTTVNNARFFLFSVDFAVRRF